MTQVLMDKAGLRFSTEKTTYVAIYNSTGRKERAGDRILLTIGGRRIVRQHSVKVLGIPFNESGDHICGCSRRIYTGNGRRQ